MTVFEINETSGAYKQGLRNGDKIIEVAGKIVKTYDDYK